VSDWMTIRVVLLGQPDVALADPPGRILLTHADHTFAELAEAVDTAFARWDLTPPHRFEVEGRILVAGGEADEAEVEDTDDVTVGEVGLRVGARFRYVFDLGERWEHECVVEDASVDPFEVAGDEPEVPVPVFGWGTIPDQYGRVTEDEDEREAVVHLELDEELDDLVEDARLDDELELDDVDLFEEGDELEGWEEPSEDVWAEPDASTWAIVAQALADVDRPGDPEALAAAAAELRARRDDEEGPYSLLWRLSDLDEDELPEDDADLWLELAAAVVVPADGVPEEESSPWTTLEPADWAGAVIELARAGVGAPAGASALIDMIGRCPEVESEELADEDRDALRTALTTVVALWRALGTLDDEARLTRLGQWGLPESLRLAWS
jgi:hypothetical protein